MLYGFIHLQKRDSHTNVIAVRAKGLDPDYSPDDKNRISIGNRHADLDSGPDV